jgi:hypothetical protein
MTTMKSLSIEELRELDGGKCAGIAIAIGGDEGLCITLHW